MKSPIVGIEIVERIADREGVDPVDLDVLLHDVIDAEALEALTRGTSNRQSAANLRVQFVYCGYIVTVVGSGRVLIDEQSIDAEQTSHRGKSQQTANRE